MKIPFVSSKNMIQSQNVVVLAAGPSISKAKDKVIKWQKERDALVIGAHYQYFIPPDYTVFTTPSKFKRAQHKVPGVYIIGPRITEKHIHPKVFKNILRIKYTDTTFIKWESESFISESGCIPHAGCGIESIMISTFCNPLNLLIIGFDGFRLHKGHLIIEHAKGATHNARPVGSIHEYVGYRKKRNLEFEVGRKHSFCNLFKFLIEIKKINLYICKEDQLRGIDKDQIKNELGVFVL